MEYIIGILAIIGLIFIISRFARRPFDNSDTDTDANIGGLGEYIEDRSLTEKAFKHFSAGDYESAIAEVDNLIDHHYNCTKEAYDMRAMSLENLGYYLDAIDDFSQSLTIDPNDAKIYYLRGLAKQIIGEYTEAREDYEKAVELKPNMQQYQQMLHMSGTFTRNSSFEQLAKEKAKEEGKLIRRTKTKTKTKTPEPNEKDFKEGLLTLIENLRAQAQGDPDNEELRKLLKESEARYMDEFPAP